MVEVMETQEVKKGPWSPDECHLAVWAYDRLDQDHRLDEGTVLQELANLLCRGFEDVTTRVQNVAACDPRPSDLKPVHGDANIQGKLRLVFSEYWADREAGRIRAGRIKGIPEYSDELGIPTCWADVLEKIASNDIAGSICEVVKAALGIIDQGEATPGGVSLQQIVQRLSASEKGRPPYLKACLDVLSRELGLCKVWYHLPKRQAGAGENEKEDPSSLAFLPAFAEVLACPARRTLLLAEVDRILEFIWGGSTSVSTEAVDIGLDDSCLSENERGLSTPELSWFLKEASSIEPFLSAPSNGQPPLRHTMERIGSLRAFPSILNSTWCARPFPEDSLQALAEASRELDQRTSRMKRPPPPDPLLFEKARARWEELGWDASKLERREVRCLCQQPETAVFPEWVDALAKVDGLKIRCSWVDYLLGNYLAQWRKMPQPEELEASLRRLLDHLSSKEEWAQEISRDVRILIGPDVPKHLLRDLPNVLTEWEAILLHWELSREAGLGHALMLEALNSWEARWRTARPKMSISEAIAELRDAFDGLLREPGIPQEVLCRVISNLILSEWAKAEPEIREHLVEFVLRHPRLGDPRKEKHRWYPMAQARDRLISWMARKDLRLFYDSVVADHADAQGRKAFWLHYVDRVSDFRLVLCEEDVVRLKSTLSGKPIQHAQMEGFNKTSAFILRFKSGNQEDDLICVEFSKTGNSLYIYDVSNFESGVGSMEALYFRAGSEPRDLKNKEYCRVRKPHIGDWQADVAWFLKGYGIHAS